MTVPHVLLGLTPTEQVRLLEKSKTIGSQSGRKHHDCCSAWTALNGVRESVMRPLKWSHCGVAGWGWDYAGVAKAELLIRLTAAVLLRDALGRGLGLHGMCRRDLLQLDWCGPCSLVSDEGRLEGTEGAKTEVRR